MCASLFCRPICIDTSWTCSIFMGQFKQGSERIVEGLCRQFKAEGCSESKCCPKSFDDELRNYVENGVFGRGMASPFLPQQCIHETDDKSAAKMACSQCKKAGIKVKLDIMDCPFPETSFLETTQFTVPTGNEILVTLLLSTHETTLLELDSLALNFPGKGEYESLAKRVRVWYGNS